MKNKSLFDTASLPATVAKKIPAEKKAPASKKPAAPTADKKAAPTVAPKVETKPAPVKSVPKAVEMVRAFAILGSAKDRYSQLTGNRKAFSAYTIAALKTSGLLDLSATGTPIAKKGNVSLFKAIVGTTAANHWTASGRIVNGAITVDGLNEVQARLSGTSRGYNTEADYVAAFMPAMAKGGTVEVAGTKYKLDSAVAAKAKA